MKGLTANSKALKLDVNLKSVPKRTQLIAFVGVAALIGAFIVKTFVLQAPANIVSPPLVAHNTAPVVKKAPKVDPGLPAVLRRALAKHPVVVAVLFSSGVPGDEDAVAAARQGAGTAHAGFAALDVGKEAYARAAALKLDSTAAPAVVVIRRPGTVSVVLQGYADAQLIAQVAAQKSTATPAP
jgi:hypothetical protein